MAKTKDLIPLDKKGYTSSFSLRGTAILTDKTFTIDAHSKSSEFIYNRMSLLLNCGPEFGTVSAQAMGGFNRDNPRPITAPSIDPDNKKANWDTDSRVSVAWEDRTDPDMIKLVHDSFFYSASIERDTNGKLVKKDFLHQYDFIEYLNNTIEDGQEYSVYGQMTYREYNGNISQDRNIRSIVLVDKDEEKRHATFTQTVLVGPDCIIDKDREKHIITVQGYVLEKVASYRGHDLKTKNDPYGVLVPMPYTFEVKVEENSEGMVKKFFMNKKGYNQLTFVGHFFFGGQVINTTEDDLDDDIKELIALGAITLEEALADCAGNTSREYKNVWDKIKINMVKNDEDVVSPHAAIEYAKYNTEDIDDLPFMIPVTEDNDDDVLGDSDEEKSDGDDDYNIDDLFS